MLKHIAKYEEIPNFSLVNFSADGSVDKSLEKKFQLKKNYNIFYFYRRFNGKQIRDERVTKEDFFYDMHKISYLQFKNLNFRYIDNKKIN